MNTKKFTVGFVKKIIGWIMFSMIDFYPLTFILVALFILEKLTLTEYLIVSLMLIIPIVFGIFILIQASKEKVEFTASRIIKTVNKVETKVLDYDKIKRVVVVRMMLKSGNKRKSHILFDDGTYNQGEQIDTCQARVGKTWIVMECSKKRLKYVKSLFKDIDFVDEGRASLGQFPTNTFFEIV